MAIAHFFLFSHFDSDIALIKLPRPVKFSDYVRPIPLSTVSTNAGSHVITMGYGLAKTNVFPDNLQHTTFKTIASQECAPHTLNLIPKDSLLCAKGTLSSLCFGDMGDPLVSAYSGKLVGLAISTWGDCEVDHPQTYTNIHPYIDWIDGVMNFFAFVQNTPEFYV